jgi:hypothetical protein
VPLPPWTVTLRVTDVNGAPVDGAELRKSTWSGSQVAQDPPVKIGSSLVFSAAEDVLSIVCDLRHPRFAPLTMNLVRTPDEIVWRWTDPARQVKTSSRSVVIEAVMGRVRGPPTRYVPEDELARRAAAAKQRLDERVLQENATLPDAKKKDLPLHAPMPFNPHAYLVTQGGGFRWPVQAPLSKFHLVDPEIIGDETAQGWSKLRSSVKEIDLGRDSDLHVVEYGEVGTGARGTRFFAGVWVPRVATRIGAPDMDFLLWLTPNTNLPTYPHDDPPYTNTYPYQADAQGKPGAYKAGQPYCDLPLNHLYWQHFLAYQMNAAGRVPVIVVPVAPSARFDAFLSRPTLMRFLKELCLWIPRAGASRLPKVYPPGPRVRRIGVSGFSAAGPKMATLIDGYTPFPDYRDAVWSSSASELDAAWGELWVMDGFFGGLAEVSRFVDRCAGWVLHGTRRLRFYKVDQTDGHWDPRNEKGPFGSLVKGGRVVEKGKGALWALSMADSGGRWHVASFGNGYLTAPKGSSDVPVLAPDSPHHMVPNTMFGHAAVTSDFARG